MPRGELRVEATLKVGPTEKDRYDLALWLRAGGGPTVLGVGPGKDQKDRISIGEMIEALADMLGLKEAFGPVAGIKSSWPWSKLFETKIVPELTVEVDAKPSVALVLELFEGDAPQSGIHLPDTPHDLKWLTIEPTFTVYQLVLSYDKARGVDLRALVEFEEQKKTAELALLGKGAPAPAPKKELVSYPFPTPPPGNANLQVRYLGLGQRFGPDVDLTAEDPLKTLFEKLEVDLATNNPSVLLEKLADTYYKPDRDWFFGAHVILRGWEVRAVLSDPALYGVEVSCTAGQFNELRIEILYQKLGSGVGVFYGELTMPTRYRTIQLGVVSLTLPSFKLWIYTNGDFKVSVGWPLGPNSIGVQVAIFTGGGGFYFAKLRSADKPGSGGRALLARRSPPVADPDYNPIIEFGIALWFGVGRSFSAGPFSAELSVTIRGSFQGILAWNAPDQKDPNSSTSISNPPDYHWFAATLGIVGVLQGEVDLKVVALSVLVRIEAVAGVAFETDYGTAVLVAASVDVEAKLRIVFITITVGFHTSIEQTFQLSEGTPASIDGPKNPFFHGMNDWAVSGVEALEAALRDEAAPAAAPAVLEAPAAARSAADREPTVVEVGFLLQPTVVYAGEAATVCGFAGLVVDTAPPPTGDRGQAPESPFEKMVDALSEWLLTEFGAPLLGSAREWRSVATALEKISKDPEDPDWHTRLTAFVSARLRFKLHGIHLTQAEAEAAADKKEVAFLPMFEDLQLSWPGHDEPVVLGEQARTRPGYAKVVADYFAELALGGLGSSPEAAGAVAAVGTEPPPTGPPLVRFIFDDYFLMISRHLAAELAAEEEKEERRPGGLPSSTQAGNAAGIGSRYLLNGMRLPDPLWTPEKVARKELAGLRIASGYTLDGQQCALVDPKTKCEATLELRPGPGPIGSASISFASGDGATSSIPPAAAVPPAPIPTWEGAAATVKLEAIPAATAQEVWVAVRGRLPWQGPKGASQSVVPLPPEIAARAGKGELKMTVQTEAPPAPPAQPGGLPAQPALLIPVTAHRVDRVRNRDLKEPSAEALAAGTTGAQGESPYAPFVYRLDGTDEATRAKIAAALAAGALAGGSLSVLYDDPKAGYRSDEVEDEQVLLAKANLSTTSQPAALTLPLRLAVGPPPGPTAANLKEVSNFALLLWELSVVQTGGFYLRYKTTDGKGLPDAIFDSPGELPKKEQATGDSAALTLAITFPAGTPVAPWHNAFLVSLGSGFRDTLYVGLADAAGVPLRTAHPSYPPGCVGFDGTWALADLLRAEASGDLYTPEWIAGLYHLLQFRLAGTTPKTPVGFEPSLWSLSLSPLKKNPGESGPGDNYRQVLPAYRFIEGSEGAANPYAAVGGSVELGFRVGDVFGNVLAIGGDEGTGHEGTFPLLYSDPLIGPGEWPGVRVAHRFMPAAGGKGPQLRLAFAFDPTVVVKPGTEQSAPEAAAHQARAALDRYATAVAQLEDPRTEAAIATSIPGLLGVLGPINAQLRKIAADIVTELEKVVAGGTAAPLTWSPEWPIEPKQLAKVAADLQPLTVELELRRPQDLVWVGEDGRPVDKSDRSAFPVPADLSPRRAPNAGDQDGAAGLIDEQATDVGLLPYAEDFEEVFKGWDGAGGLARLAARHDREDLAANASMPPLWVVRMTTTDAAAGIDVKFDGAKAAYYSLAPLALELISEKAWVTEYDEELKPIRGLEQAFTGIDLDLWAEAFLAAVDEVLSPAIGTAIALGDAKGYEELTEAKAELAAGLALGVQPVFVGGADEERGTGEAREAFEQSLRAKLASAFTVSTIVQVPAKVSAHGVEGGPAPRLFGTVSAGAATPKAGSSSGEPDSGGKVALSSPKLPLADGSSEPFLTFMASAADPGEAAVLELELAWNARFVEHLIEADRSDDYGYEPSEWLRFVRERPDDPLDFKLGRFEVPVPSRRFPPMPVLEGQAAIQDPASKRAKEDLGKFLRWSYGSRLTLPELEAPDVLRVDITYNRPLKKAPDLTELKIGEPNLFGALAAFTAVWPQLRPHLQALPDDPVDPVARRAVEIFVKAAREVAAALIRHYAPPVSAAVAPGERTDRYAINFGRKGKDEVELFAQAPPKPGGECENDAIVWPLLAGKGPKTTPERTTEPPDDEGCWYVARYDFEAPPPGEAAALALEWPQLDILSRQTGTTACRRTRNTDLSEGGDSRRTNPAFVYKTAPVAYDNPVVPSIVATGIHPSSELSLAQTLEQVLAPLATAGTGVSQQRLLKLWCNYSYTLVGEGAEAVRSSDAVLLADQINLLPEDDDGDGEGLTLVELCAEVDANCKAWYRYFRPSRKEASLTLGLVLFADVEDAKLPIIQVQDLEIDVLDDWWGGSEEAA